MFMAAPIRATLLFPVAQSVFGGHCPAGLATTVYTGICLVTILVTGTHRVRTWVSVTVLTRSSMTILVLFTGTCSVTVENLVSLRLTWYGTRTCFVLVHIVVFIS